MQANSIAKHLGTTSATTVSYESYVETVRTFCQTINHANQKSLHEKVRHKALQAELGVGSGGGRGANRGCGRVHGGRGSNPGRGGRQSQHGGRVHREYHNWNPTEEFDKLDTEAYQRLIPEWVAHGEVQANTSSTAPIDRISTKKSLV